MNMSDLKKSVAESTGLSQDDADKALKAGFAVITKALKDEDTVVIPDFGSFSIGHREARTGRNPRTGEPLQIAASKSVKFKAGKTLKNIVNN